jgi:hypothetical protein
MTPPVYPQAPSLYSQQPSSTVSKVAPVVYRALLWLLGTAALALAIGLRNGLTVMLKTWS